MSISDSCSENTDFLVSLPSDFFQVHTSDSEAAIEDTVTEELSISSDSFKGVIDNLMTNLDTLSTKINEIEQMENSYITNGLASPLSTSSPLKQNAKKKISYGSIDSLMHEMVNTYEYNDKLLKSMGNGHAQHNIDLQEKNFRTPDKNKENVGIGLENQNNNLQGLDNGLENVSPHITTLNNSGKLDSVSKENLWLKLGKEIYRRQNLEKKFANLEEKLLNYEKKIAECEETDCQKNNLLDELAARSAMILSQVRSYSTINEKLNRDLQSERKSKKDILEAMKEKIEHYKSDSVKAMSRCNSYKTKMENAEKKLNDFMSNYQKIEEQTKNVQLNIEQKNEEIDRLQSELAKLQNKNRNINEMYNETLNKCCEFEKEILVLNKKKKLLLEKTFKYDQLLDQKRRIEEIVNQMKSSEVETAEELSAAREEIKTVKDELKSFYQQQLDAMLAEKVSDYQRKLDGIVQITNEENRLTKLQLNNQIVKLKERYEKEKTQINTKHTAEIENLEMRLKNQSERISSLEKRLESEVQEKRQLVKSVLGVVNNVNIDSQSNSKSSSDVKYARNTSDSNSFLKLDDDFSFFEQEKLLHKVTPTELRKHIEILLNKCPGNPLAQK